MESAIVWIVAAATAAALAVWWLRRGPADATAPLQRRLQAGDVGGFWADYAERLPARYDGRRWREQQRMVDLLHDHADRLRLGHAARRLLIDTRDTILDTLTGAADAAKVDARLAEVRRLVDSRGAWPQDQVAEEDAVSVRGGDDWAIAELRLDRGLAAQLRSHVARAQARGLAPIMEIKADWGPPSAKFGKALADPRMHAALRGAYLVRADLDFSGTTDEAVAWFPWTAFPVFFALGPDARPTGLTIASNAWGADVPENIAPVFERFVARARGG